MGRKAEPIEQRLDRWIQKGGPDECWPWLGARDAHGYGRIQMPEGFGNGVTRGAHRVMWEVVYGMVPEYRVMHICDNRSCCNPRHLRLKPAGRKLRQGHLTAQERAEIRLSRALAEELAEQYGVSARTIRKWQRR